MMECIHAQKNARTHKHKSLSSPLNLDDEGDEAGEGRLDLLLCKQFPLLHQQVFELLHLRQTHARHTHTRAHNISKAIVICSSDKRLE